MDQSSQISFSVVLPLYNKCESVSNSIRSILQQSIADFELIVVNDGSSDGSEDVVAAIDDDRIRLINQANQGVSAARNKGIAEAQYAFVAFIDADDLWHPEYLQSISDLIKLYPKESSFGTAWKSWLRHMEIPTVKEPMSDDQSVQLIDYPQHSISDVIVHICSLVVKRSVLLESGGFPVGVKIFEDQDLCCRLSQHHKIVFDPTPLVFYVKDSENRACDIRKLQPMPPFFKECEALMLLSHEKHSYNWHLKEFLVARYLQEVSLAMQTPGARSAGVAWLMTCRKTQLHKKRFIKAFAYLILPSKVLQNVLSRVTNARKKQANTLIHKNESSV